MEREKSLGFFKRGKIELSAVVHSAVRLITELPLVWKILRAPQGQLVKDGTVLEKGRLVTDGNCRFLATDDGRLIYPNKNGGELIVNTSMRQHA